MKELNEREKEELLSTGFSAFRKVNGFMYSDDCGYGFKFLSLTVSLYW